MMGVRIKETKIKDRPFLCRTVYADGMGCKLLYSVKDNLRGKPDFIFKSRITGRLLPMELKSGKVDGEPNYGDVMQLAAYFVIIEEAMGKRPKKGYLRYQNAMFVVKNSGRLRKELKAVLANMRNMLENGEGEADPSFVNCRYCVARDTVCEYC